MQPAKLNDNLRDSYRCSVDGPQQGAQLRLGDDWVPVQLLDESRGGFGVVTQEVPGVAVGDLLRLRTLFECFDVEVMYVVEQPAEDAQEPPGVRLGLRRVKEILPEAELDLPWYHILLRSLKRIQPNSSWKYGTVGLGFALLVGIAPLVAIVVWEPSAVGDRRAAARAAARRDRAPDPWVERISQSLPWRSIQSPQRRVVPPAVTNEEQQRRNWQQLLDAAKQQTELGQWDDPVLATMASVGDRVHLDKMQLERISAVLKRASDTLAAVPSDNDRGNAKRMATLRATYDEIMPLLSDAQRVQWTDVLRDVARSTPAASR